MYKPARFRSLTSKLTRVLQKMGGGLNNGLPPFNIKDNEATETYNVGTYDLPALTGRKKRSDFGTALTGTIYHLGTRENDNITAVHGTDWSKWTGSAWSVIGTLTTSADADSIDFRGDTVLVNGTDNKKYDGSTYGDVPTMPNGHYLATHANRCYLANKNNQYIYFSALADIDDWSSGALATSGGAIEIVTSDNDPATGLTSYADHIVYFKQRSMHELYGTNKLNYQMKTVSESIGCVSHRSIVEVKGLLFFLSEEGVRVYGGGTIPRLVSDNIEGYINDIDKTKYEDCVAGTDGERYFLLLQLNGGSRVLLTYDLSNRIWTAEDDINIIEFTSLNGELYGIMNTGQVKLMQDDSSSETFNWTWTSKPYNDDSLSTKSSYYKMYALADIPTGNTLKIYLSSEARDGTFTLVETITAETDYVNKRVFIPIDKFKDVEWLRIKLEGTQDTVVHAIERNYRLRQLPF